MDIINQVLQGDTLETLRKIEDKTFDFCFADPPYYMQIEDNKKLIRVEGKEFKGCNDDWDKFPSMEYYKEWTKAYLSEIKRVLKDNGSICIISGMQSIYEIGNILRELGFWILNDIIWLKSNPTPNFSGSRLNNSHETLIWASKNKNSKFTFNYKTGKVMNNGKQMGSVWTFPVCCGNERLKDDKNEKLHTTQKPEALLYRIINLFTKKGDLILDPFGGTMTTGVVAKRCGRNYTMIERENKYIKYGIKRLEETTENIGDIENAIYDIKPLKVTMNEMTEAGYFKLGEFFYLKNGEKAKFIKENGNIEYNNMSGSMHEICAKMQGKERRVNAFDFFYVIRNETLKPIKEIREEYRKVKANEQN